MSTLRDINISNGVSPDYNARMTVSNITQIPRGTLTKLRIRPEILNEHQESSREVLGTVTSATTVGQIFKASKNNINSILLTLESDEAEVEIDNIEQANDAALQIDWVLVGANLATLNTLIKSSKNGSTKSMQLMMDSLDTWTNTLVSTTNMSGATIEFDYQQTKETAKAEMTLTIGDGVGSSTFILIIQKVEIGTWKHMSIPISSFIGTANAASITTVAFSVTNSNGGEFAYVDNIAYRQQPGSVSFELWDFGTSIPPTGGTMDYTTGGTQYMTLGDLGIGGISTSAVTIDLSGGKNAYKINEFVAGAATEIPTNNLLTIGNYYGIVIKYEDTDVSVYGANTNYSISYYDSGYAWTAPTLTGIINIATGQTGGGAYSDIMFGILSTQEVYIIGMEMMLLDSSNTLIESSVDSEHIFVVEDENMKMEIITSKSFLNKIHKEDMSLKPVYMNNGGKAEIYYYTSVDESVFYANFEIEYLYKKPTTNG